MTRQGSLTIDLDDIEIEEIEVFLQEGSRGSSEFAASCSTICHYLCCAPSCACGAPDVPSSEDKFDELLSD